ncbi:unnamed protein product, partial [Cyprideis torosa]
MAAMLIVAAMTGVQTYLVKDLLDKIFMEKNVAFLNRLPFLLVVILLGVVFYMNWKLALFSFFILPIAALPIVHFGKLFRKLSTRTQEETAQVSNMLYETITGTRIVKAFCKEDYESKRFTQQILKLFKVTIEEAKFRSVQHPLMEFIGGIAFALIIWYGGQDVIVGRATPGTFFAFLTALIAAYDPVKGISRINSTIQQGMAAATRVFNILDIEPEITDTRGATPLPPFSSSIVFDNLCFSYDGENKVLTDINLTVTAGEALAIVGPSGGGKTTLTNLIPRFLEVSQGEIRIDDKEIRTCTLASLRGQIAMVTQQTILFNDTVRNNIAYGNLEATEKQIHDAAAAAHALLFIEDLPEGFETIIGEGGSRLSGGLLYSPAPILDRFIVLKKYRELLFVPIFISLFHNDPLLQKRCEYAFLGGCITLLLISYAMYFQILPSERY